MGSQADDVVRAAVAVAHGIVGLRRRSGIDHHVAACSRTDVHQSHLVADAVGRHVDESYLPAFGVLARHVEHAYLRAVERVGIVDGSYLHASLQVGRDIEDGR